jgi:serpin B
MCGTNSKALAIAAIFALAGTPVLPHVAVAQAPSSTATLAAAFNASGVELLRQFSASPGNIVFSPYSIGSAMSMVLSGARGDTEREMLSALKQRLTREEIAPANSVLLASLNKYDRSAVPPTCPPGMQLRDGRCWINPLASAGCPPSTHREGEQCAGGATFPASAKLLLANALMLSRQGLVSADFVSLLKDKYAAELLENAGVAEINAWVSRKTEGKIQEIIKILPNMAVINAIYFKSRWAMPFQKVATKDETFHLSSTQEVKVPMMHRTANYALVERQGYRAIFLPYDVGTVGMVIVLPNEVDGLADVTGRFDETEQSELMAALRAAMTRKPLVELSLPRFKTEYEASLIGPLQNAGMKLAFDRARADFSGITGRQATGSDRLYFDTILHRALIEANEETTEAAATTVVGVMVTAAPHPQPPPKPEVFRVDRPFLFHIVDQATGAILFTGRISRPE